MQFEICSIIKKASLKNYHIFLYVKALIQLLTISFSMLFNFYKQFHRTFLNIKSFRIEQSYTNLMGKLWLKLTLLALTCTLSVSFFSATYRKCIVPIKQTTVINNLGDMQIERVGVMHNYPQMQPIINHRLPLQYIQNSSIIYHQYLGAGASGQVYIVEHQYYSPSSVNQIKIEPKIVKRFFHEELKKFEQENFIMSKLGQQVQWMKQFGTYRMPAQDYQVLPGQHHNQYTTMAFYPFKNSKELYQVSPDNFKTQILLYKLAQKLYKSHSLGIIHHDIKLANILVTIDNPSIPELFDVKLIDWNLASFYYPGYQTIEFKGTPCYFSPQQLFGTRYITPAIDVWTLGLIIFQFLAEKKPFKINCSLPNNLLAIGSLVGLQAIQKILQKYRFDVGISPAKNMQIMRKNPMNYTKIPLEDLIPQQKRNRFDMGLLDLLKGMINPDLEERLTMEQVLNHSYFDSVRRLPPMYYARNKKLGMMTHEMLTDWEDYNQFPQDQSFNAQLQHQNYKGDRESQQINHRFDLEKYKIDIEKKQEKPNEHINPIKTENKKGNKKSQVSPIVHKRMQEKGNHDTKSKQQQKKLNQLENNRKNNNFDKMIQNKQQKVNLNKNSPTPPIQNKKTRRPILANKKQEENQKLVGKQTKIVSVAIKRKKMIAKHKKINPKPQRKKLRIF